VYVSFKKQITKKFHTSKFKDIKDRTKFFYCPHMKYGKYWFHLQFFYCKFSRFWIFYTYKTSLERKKIRVTRRGRPGVG
jgi:hypothetical protein